VFRHGGGITRAMQYANDDDRMLVVHKIDRVVAGKTDAQTGRKALTGGCSERKMPQWIAIVLDGVIAESSRKSTLSRVEEGRARISKGPEGILERFRRPNVIAVEGDVLPSQRSDMGEHGIVDDLALRA